MDHASHPAADAEDPVNPFREPGERQGFRTKPENEIK